jgi:hypothetical protein
MLRPEEIVFSFGRTAKNRIYLTGKLERSMKQEQLKP